MKKQLFATKNPSFAETSPLKRTLSAFDLTLLGVGCIVGTGIFVLTGTAAASNAGPAIAISFAIAALVAALGALCYAEMASMIPNAGSAYAYAYATLGELVAFIIGWDLILEWLIGAAAVSVGWSGYVSAFVKHVTGWAIPDALSQAPLRWNDALGVIETTGNILNLPAVLIVLCVTTILVFGVRESADFNAKIVFVKIGVILLFIGFAAFYVNPDNWHPFIPENTGQFGKFGVSGIFQAATIVFFAYLGFDAVSVAAQETKNPARDVPIGIFGSLLISTVLYIAVSLVLTGVVPYQLLGVAQPIAVGIAATGLSWLETVVEIGTLAGLTTVILVMLYAQPRILFSMASDGLLPAVCAKVHPVYRTPYVITIITGGACAICAGLLPIALLAELTSIGTLFAFVIVSVGVGVLRRKRPDLPRKFRVPGGPYLVPGLCALSSTALMCTGTRGTLVRLFVWMALGLLIYFGYSRKQSKLASMQAS